MCHVDDMIDIIGLGDVSSPKRPKIMMVQQVSIISRLIELVSGRIVFPYARMLFLYDGRIKFPLGGEGVVDCSCLFYYWEKGWENGRDSVFLNPLERECW